MRYPLNVELGGKKCVVAGGGVVAERKVEGLLRSGARVAVVSPRMTPTLQALAYQGRIEWSARPFSREDARGAFLLFAATGDPKVNRAVLEAGTLYGALVNVADDPEGSDFHVPALLAKGPVTVAVSTGGFSPALSAHLRDRLEKALPEGLDKTARLLSELRARLSAEEKKAAPELFKKLLDGGLADDMAKGDIEAARRKTEMIFGPGTFPDGF